MTDVTLAEFIHEAFRVAPPDAAGWLLRFPGDPDQQKGWGGERFDPANPPDIAADVNVYLSTAAMKADATKRGKAQAIGQLWHVLDDPGGKGIPAGATPPVSYKVQTSPGSQQWGLFFTRVATAAEGDEIARLTAKLGWADRSGNNSVRYVRPPVGVNAKAKYGAPYRVHAVEWHPEHRIDPADLIAWLRSQVASRGADSVPDTTTDTELERLITTGETLHGPLVQLSARLAGRGRTKQEIIDHLTGLMEQGRGLHSEWQARLDSIPGIVVSALAKFTPKPLPAVDQLLKDHALIFEGNTLQVLWLNEWPEDAPTPRQTTTQAARLYYANRPVNGANPFNAWLNDPRRKTLRRFVFDPTGEADTDEVFNLFDGFAIEPEDGDCSLFLAHLRDVICCGDASLYEYVLQWLAHMFQKPAELPGTALALYGGQGAGKGFLARFLGDILGRHYIHLTGNDAITGRFNAAIAGKLMVFADESLWSGDRRGADRMKALMSEQEIGVERKYHDVVMIKNFARFIFATNHDSAAPAEVDDRRYVPLHLSPAHIGDAEYWAKLEAERAKGGPAAFLRYALHEVELTRNIRATPKTAMLATQKLLSLDRIGQFWRALLLSGGHVYSGDTTLSVKFGMACGTENLHHVYLRWALAQGDRHPVSIDAFGIAIRKWVTLSKREARVDEATELGLNRRAQVYALPTLAEARQQFEQRLGHKVYWPGEPESVSWEEFE